MATVLQLRRELKNRPEIPSIAGLDVRTYQETDILAWLELRHQAFARQRIGVRQWTESDFHSEFTSRWWWRPEHMWLAESSEPSPFGRGRVSAGDSPWRGEGAGDQPLIGAVTLAMRGEPDQPEPRPVVHWLIVHPRWRRRGIGRLLMAHLEAAAWDVGYRDVWLETHAAWEAAAKFYESLGYRSAFE
jgi:GNAT superfamily N-acetyltransferase